MGKKNKYSWEAPEDAKVCKARGAMLRVHFKNTREAAHILKNMSLKRAQRYLNDVLKHKDTIPFNRYRGHAGRHAMGQKFKESSGGQSRWPEKSCRFLLDLLQNAESNAEIQGIDVESLYVAHIQVNKAPKMRRRTYRAHGRIGPYMASPCHIELVLMQKQEGVAKGDEAPAASAETGKLTGPKSRVQRIEQGATAGSV